jgi:hypothetical protein
MIVSQMRFVIPRELVTVRGNFSSKILVGLISLPPLHNFFCEQLHSADAFQREVGTTARSVSSAVTNPAAKRTV